MSSSRFVLLAVNEEEKTGLLDLLRCLSRTTEKSLIWLFTIVMSSSVKLICYLLSQSCSSFSIFIILSNAKTFLLIELCAADLCIFTRLEINNQFHLLW